VQIIGGNKKEKKKLIDIGFLVFSRVSAKTGFDDVGYD
jgi:hypothetical protein